MELWTHQDERIAGRLVGKEVGDETRAALPRAQLRVREQRAPYRRRHELLRTERESETVDETV